MEPFRETKLIKFTRRNFLRLFPAVTAASLSPAELRGLQASTSKRLGQTYSQLGYKIYILDFQFSDIDPNTLKLADPEKYAESMKEMGVETLLVYANNVYGLTFFKSQYTQKLKNISDDFLGDYIEACRKRNIKTVLYHSVYWQEQLALEHPEWRLLDAKGNAIRFGGQGVEGGVTFLCMNSPFRDLYMKQVKEIADRYVFDSWFVDEYFFHQSLVCYNPYCLEKWKARTGEDLPKPLSQKHFPQYLDFMVETYQSFYRQIKDQLRTSGRNVPTTHNFGLDYSNDDYVIMESNPSGFDFYQLSARTKFYRSQARGRELQMIPHRGNAYTDGTNAPLPHLTWQTAVAISHNAAVMWADQANVDGTLDVIGINTVKETFRVADRLIPKVRGTVPYAEIAILASERDFQLNYEDYLDYYGAHKLLTDLHWPFDVVAAEQLGLSDLEKYQLVIVPSLQYISEERSQNILRYLQNGGHLLFCGQSTQYDVNGRPHASLNSGLVKVRETSEPRAYIKTVFPIDDSRLKAAHILTIEPESDHKVLGTLIRPTVHESASSPFKDAPYPGQVTEQPVIVSASRGKGRFVCIGYRFFREYLNQNLPVFFQVLRGVLEDIYHPSIWVDAPLVVEALFNQLGNELRISLINGITSRPSGGHLFAERGQRGHINIVEVIPITDITIHLPRKSARQATNLAGKRLSIVQHPDNWVIRVPRIEQYEVITIEM